jgi:hypothetical protein
MHRYRLLSIAPTAGPRWTKQGVSGMTNHEYLKQQSPEWLADKLAEIMDCDCCPAACDLAELMLKGDNEDYLQSGKKGE